MSLWNVDDKSTEILMTQFAQYLYDGVDVPKALRRSALDLRANGAPPWQWGSFTVFGGGRG